MKVVDYNEVFNQFYNSRVIIAGPCSVESKEQINIIASEIKKLGLKFLRAGAFKPRTSPQSFQGMGFEGQKLIKQAADENGLYVVSEILDTSHIDECYDLIDIIQIGSRSMGAYGLLKNIGKATAKDKKIVLLKRGFNSTLNEMLMASVYITEEGNPNVLLCLRGIRTFEQIDSDLRFTPDLASIIELKEKTKLPVIFDPSHASGDVKYVDKLSKAALLLGADGLLIEVHNEPEKALSDGKQSIYPEQLKSIIAFSQNVIE